MSPVDRLKYLLSAYQENTITRSEFEEFVTYIQNPEYNDTLIALMDENTVIDGLKDNVFILPNSNGEGSKHITLTGPRRFLPWLAASAAVLILMLIPMFYPKLISQSEPHYITMATANGDLRELTLPDGSSVTLNAGSKLIYPERFSDSLRDVTLIGEAFFEVTSDADRPFVVSTEKLKTKVLGTSFNIKSFKGESQEVISVASGRVLVFSENREQKNEVVLIPEEQVVYQQGNLEKKRVDLSEVLSWKTGVLLFKQSPLSEAVAMLERKYDVDIEIQSKNLINCTVTGEFKNSTSLEQVLENFRYVLDVHYEFKTTGQIVITGNGQVCQ